MATGIGGTILTGPEGLARLGQQVAALGDVNGDGHEDFAVTALRAGNGYSEPGQDDLDEVGIVYVVYGREGDLAASLDFQFGVAVPDGLSFTAIQGGVALGQFGSSLARAGDLNGDGLDDILVGSPRLNGNDGVVHVIYGRQGGLGGVVDVGALGDGGAGFAATPASFGNIVTGLGDVNGDGRDDFLAISSADRTGWLVFGGSIGFPTGVDLTSQLGTQLLKLGNSGNFGAAAGDLNDDGIADFVTRNSTGFSVQFGSTALTAGVIDLDARVMDGRNGMNLSAPSTLSGAWKLDDVNGDRIDDLLVTSFTESWVVFGRATGFGATLDLSALDGTDGFHMVGSSFMLEAGGIGDVNGDGLRDFVLGANAGAGTGFLVFGRSDGHPAELDLDTLDGTNGYRVTGLVAGDMAIGGELADVNGDGFADWLLPITGMDAPQRLDAGGMAIIYGGPGRLAALDAADGTVDGLLSLAHLDDLLTFVEPDPVPIDDEPLPTPGDDNLRGTAGDDRVDLLAGNDVYAGGDGNDVIIGGTGRDTLQGQGGNDSIRGGGGVDQVLGGAGRDTLSGFKGNDRLTGGEGSDQQWGGDGADRFVFADGDGRDTIRDFNPAVDFLVLDSNLWTGVKTVAQVLNDHAQFIGGVIALDFGSGDSIRLAGIFDQGVLLTQIEIV